MIVPGVSPINTSRPRRKQLASRSANSVAGIAIVFIAYIVAGKVGLSGPFVHANISLLWPASGVALAAVLLGGYWVWPGIAAGAFFFNLFLNHVGPLAATGMMSGNTLAALTGGYLLRRLFHFENSLSRLRDVLALIFASAASPVVAASIGVPVLSALHAPAWPTFGFNWLRWWLGDAMGVLLVTPLALTFPDLLKLRFRARGAELGVALLLLTAVCFLIFDGRDPLSARMEVLAFAVFPFVIWVAIRGGVSGAAVASILTASIATTETGFRSGPFVQSTPSASAALLQLFFAVISISGLTLAAVIAERERAENEREQLVRRESQREAQLRYSAIIESADDGIIAKDMNGIITDWNKGAERLYGYSAEEMIGRSISLIVPSDCEHDRRALRTRLRQGETIHRHETVHQRKDGTRIAVSLTISPIRDLQGRIVGASVISRDISEQKRVADALRRSDQRFRLFANAAPMMIWASGADKLCTYFNQRWLDFTGRPLEAELGKGWVADVHPDDLATCLAAYNEAFDRREVFSLEYRLRRHDGEYRWVFHQGVPVFEPDNSFTGYIGSAIDVTDSRMAEQALRTNEERLRQAAELAGLGTYRWNVQSGATEWDAKSKAMWGLPPDAAVDYEAFLRGIHPDDRPYVEERLARTMNPAGDGVYEAEYRVIGRDGIQRWVSARGRTTFVDGRPVTQFGVAMETTARKQAENTLRGISARLIHVQEEERSRIARELHDDINQRLALLAIEMDRLRHNLPDHNGEIASRLGHLLRRTHDISRDIQSISHQLHSSKLEELGMAVGMKSFCEEIAGQLGVEIEFTARHIPPQVPRDITLSLFRVLQESLRNAAKHSGAHRFLVQLSGSRRHIQLIVRDSGVGFDPELAMKNRGLGLTSMRERIGLVHGTLTIKSKPKGGTVVNAQVPLGPGPSSESQDQFAA